MNYDVQLKQNVKPKTQIPMYNIPILFVIFKRKDVSLRAFAQIKKMHPARLYIACDGPRPNVEGEAEMVEATR